MPNYQIKRMNIYPALSASLKYSQGRYVRSEYFMDRALPVLGRGPDKLIFSSSRGGGVINISDQKFFDDSITGRVAVSEKSIKSDFSSDDGRLQSVFSYDYTGYTMGMTDTDPLPGLPWYDKPKFDCVEYLKDPNSISEIIVNDDPSAIDELDYNGVLEPLTIRAGVGMSSTFIGNEFDPFPHSIKGGIGGTYALEPYSRFNLITNFYKITDSNRNLAFKYCVDYRLFEGFSEYVPDPTYTISGEDKIKPFVDQTLAQFTYRGVSNEEIQDLLIASSSISSSLDNRPSPDSITKPCGFVYSNSIFGTDSLIYGGLLK